jgi:putative hydrolase of the HAD superfamily
MVNRRITTLFCDIGGVLLTNGWGRHTRAQAAEHFGFDIDDFDDRHQLCFYLFEIGEITLKEYLTETLFYRQRNFTMESFIDFMHDQSKPYDDMIAYIKDLRQKYHLKVVLLSNEGRELADFRIKNFALNRVADFFIVSSYVYLRKPDIRIFQMAVDLAQSSPESIIYIDDRQMFIDVSVKMGIHGVRHIDLKTTQNAINGLLTQKKGSQAVSA